jgi:hypothetical protein
MAVKARVTLSRAHAVAALAALDYLVDAVMAPGYRPQPGGPPAGVELAAMRDTVAAQRRIRALLAEEAP